MTSPDPVQPAAMPAADESSHHRCDLKEWACYIGMAGLIGLFCFDLLIGGNVPFFRDLTNYAYPLRWSLHEALLDGRLPLWDRHFAQGFPNLAAFQTGVFYPPHWIMGILPFYASIRLLCVFHFLVAGLGALALLRHWKYPRDLAMTGAIMFALGGVMVSLGNLLNHFQSAVWLPWLLLAWDRLIAKPAWRGFMMFVLVLTVQFLAGSPEFTAMSLALAVCCGFRHWPSMGLNMVARSIGLMVAGIVVMTGLAMVQVLPTAELVGQTYRSAGTGSNALVWSMEPASLLNLFVVDHEVDLGQRSGIRYFFDRPMPLFLSSYIGVISLFGIMLWGWYSGVREKLFLGGSIVLSIAVALGAYTPVYPLCLKLVPVLGAIRFPEKYLFVTYALLILAAVRGVHRFRADTSRPIVGAIVSMAIVLAGWVTLWVTSLVAPGLFGGPEAPFVKQIAWQALLTTAMMCVIAQGKMHTKHRVLLSVGMVGIVFFDLTRVHQSHLYPLDPSKLEAAPRLVSPDQTRLTRYFYYPSRDNLHPHQFRVAGTLTHPREIALFYQNWLPNMGVMHGIDYFQEIDALGRRPYSDFLKLGQEQPFENQVRLLRSFNVRHVVSFQKLPERDAGIKKVGYASESRAWLYEVEDPVPRVFLAAKFIVGDDPERTLLTLANPKHDARDIVIIDRDLGVSQQPGVPGDAAVSIREYDHDRVVLDAASAADVLLVLADAHYPGWKAYVDGMETRIARANHFYRAIKLPAGSHRIEFQYEPRLFNWGLGVSLCTLLGLVAATIRLRERQPS